MRITTKLKWAAWVPVIVALMVCAALFFSYQLLENTQQKRAISRQVSDGMHDLSSLAYTYMLFHEERPRQQFIQKYNAVMTLIKGVRLGDAAQQQYLESMARSMESMNNEFTNLVAEFEATVGIDRNTLFAQAEDRLAGQILIRSHEAQAHASRLRNLIDEEIATTQARINIFILLLIGLTTFPITYGLKRMMTSIGTSLTTLRQGTEVVAAGNLNHRIDLFSDDEIGELARAFDAMTIQLHETTVSKEELLQEVQERKRVQEDLGREREWLRVTLSSIGDAVIATDGSGNISFLNPVAAALTGWPSEEALGQSVEEVFEIVNESTREPAEDIVRKVLSEGCIVVLANQTALIARNGKQIPIEDSAAPIRDHSGRIIGAVLVFHDVTVKRRAQDALRASESRFKRLNEELEQKIRQRTADLARTVDTLQTEIEQRKWAEAELMRANTQLSVRANQLRALAGELTTAELRERKRVSKILHDGLQQDLAVAKLQVGGLSRQLKSPQLRQEAEAIEKLLAESIDMSRSLSADLSPPILHESGLEGGLEWLARRLLDKHGINVDLSIDTPIELPEDAKVLVFESVRELLFNAVKHAKVSRAQLRVQHLEGVGVRIVVSDEGVGFDPAGLKAVGDKDGGFGLFSISERLGLLGGDFEVNSTPGKGSRFVLTIPSLQVQATRLAAPRGGAPLVGHSEAQTHLSDKGPVIRALIADDHALFRDGVARLVDKEADIRCIGQAANGREAIDLAHKLKPDVILMDINMPEVSGLEATLAIHEDLPEIRIIGLSMHDDPELAQAMYAAGAVGYKNKSCAAAELVAAIREAVTSDSRTGEHGYSGEGSR
jgi:PAS domain S-box-containing protein